MSLPVRFIKIEHADLGALDTLRVIELPEGKHVFRVALSPSRMAREMREEYEDQNIDCSGMEGSLYAHISMYDEAGNRISKGVQLLGPSFAEVYFRFGLNSNYAEFVLLLEPAAPEVFHIEFQILPQGRTGPIIQKLKEKGNWLVRKLREMRGIVVYSSAPDGPEAASIKIKVTR